jgi:ketosteroid isomerase-like protein
MNRDEIETALRAAYDARARNDAAGVSRIFAPDATFSNAGDPAFCSAVATHAGPALYAALEKLCDVFRASAFDVKSMVVEGDRAAVICRADFRYVPTGAPLSLDLVHFWTFRDGKAAELVEYFDTAHVAHVMSQPG